MIPGDKPRDDGVEPDAGERRYHEHVDAERDGTNVATNASRIVDEIRLRQHHDRRRAALPREREIAFDSPKIHVARQRRRDERDVDVGGDDLRRRHVAGGLSPKCAPARTDTLRIVATGGSPCGERHVSPSRRPRENPRRDAAVWRKRPGRCASMSPGGSRTTYRSRCCETTRAVSSGASPDASMVIVE